MNIASFFVDPLPNHEALASIDESVTNMHSNVASPLSPLNSIPPVSNISNIPNPAIIADQASDSIITKPSFEPSHSSNLIVSSSQNEQHLENTNTSLKLVDNPGGGRLRTTNLKTQAHFIEYIKEMINKNVK